MNQKKSKALRRISAKYSNPKSKGLLNEGFVELFRKEKIMEKIHEKDNPWYIRVFLRKYAADSRQKLYRVLKRLYTQHKLPKLFLSQLSVRSS